MIARLDFENIEIAPTRIYDIEEIRAFLTGQGIDVDAIAHEVRGKFMSAFIRADLRALCFSKHKASCGR